jgi:hypothetical protein
MFSQPVSQKGLRNGQGPLFDPVVFLKIVFAAQDLNVLGVFRGAPLRVWDNVIEMQTGIRAAFPTFALVALPNFELYPTRDNAVIFRYWVWFTRQNVALRMDQPEFELEDLSAC